MSPKRYWPPRCAKLASWPQADRKCWTNAPHNGDILEPRSVGSKWAPLTRSRVGMGYGRWLSWLHVNGFMDPDSSPRDRVTPERVTAYVTSLQAINAPNTVLCRVQELRLALAIIASEQDWTWIRRLECRLRRAANSARGRRTGVVSSDRLYNLGLTMMAEAASTETPVTQAMQFRDGLMIAFLAARPLRRHNFAAIEIGRHLVPVGDGYRIQFAAAETKTKTPIEVPLPTALVPYLQRYLALHRPLLAQCDGYWNRVRAKARPSSALWLSQHGTPLAEVAMSDRFRKLTQARLGRPVTMHRFRDAAATSIATDDPEHVLITKCILGHTSLRSSERYYNHANSLQAVRRHQAGILELRRTLACETRKRRPRKWTRTAKSPSPTSTILTEGN